MITQGRLNSMGHTELIFMLKKLSAELYKEEVRRNKAIKAELDCNGCSRQRLTTLYARSAKITDIMLELKEDIKQIINKI